MQHLSCIWQPTLIHKVEANKPLNKVRTCVHSPSLQTADPLVLKPAHDIGA